MDTLEVWDYVVMTVLVAVSCLVGVYHMYAARKVKATKDFLVTNKELGSFSLSLSITATIMSAIAMLGLPMEIYVSGLSFLPYSLPFPIAGIIGSYLFLPVFYKMDKNTIFEYLELRFCSQMRVLISVLLTLLMLTYTACVIYAPALAINQVTGLNLWASIGSIGAVCILYTSMGGLKAVVWADVIQLVVMTVVVLILVVKGLINLGGLSVMWEKLVDGGRSDIIVWRPDPNFQYSIWTMTIGAPIYCLGVLCLNQSTMQRCLSSTSLNKARLSLICGGVGVGVTCVIIMLSGAVAYAQYHNCDPLISGRIRNYDQVIALFAMETLSFCKGLTGIFVAGLLCATLSTLSSMLNSLTAITIDDYVRLFYPNLSNKTSIRLSKYLAIVYGGICIGLVAVVDNTEGILKMVFSIGSLLGGPVMVVFTIGMLLPWVKTKGAVAGIVASLILPWWSWIGRFISAPHIPKAPFTNLACTNSTPIIIENSLNHQLSWLDNFYLVPQLWYHSWSLGVGLTVALVFSFFTGFQNANEVDPQLLFTFMRRFTLKKPDEPVQNGIKFKTNNVIETTNL